MKQSGLWQALVVFAFVLIVAVPSLAQRDENPLDRLEPLAGKDWVCTSWDGEKPKQKQTLRWDVILGGYAIREKMEKPEIDFCREGFFYWDGERQRIVSLVITNNGLIGHADMSWEDGKFVLRGRMVANGGRSMKTKESYELVSDKKLINVSYNPTDDGWVQRHVLEYER